MTLLAAELARDLLDARLPDHVQSTHQRRSSCGSACRTCTGGSIYANSGTLGFHINPVSLAPERTSGGSLALRGTYTVCGAHTTLSKHRFARLALLSLSGSAFGPRFRDDADLESTGPRRRIRKR